MNLTTFRKFLEAKDVLIVESSKEEIYQKYYNRSIDEVHDLFDKMEANPKAAENTIKQWHQEMYQE